MRILKHAAKEGSVSLARPPHRFLEAAGFNALFIVYGRIKVFTLRISIAPLNSEGFCNWSPELADVSISVSSAAKQYSLSSTRPVRYTVVYF